jgi:Carboxypeptidase regulatory-like domain
MKRVIYLITAIAILCVAVFSQTGSAKGKVKAPNGKGISEASVTAFLDGTEVQNVVTNEKGEFLISDLKEGIYSFVFEKTGFNSGSLKRMQILSGQVRNLGDLGLRITDNRTYVILRASVLDQDGRSVQGAKVEISRVDGNNYKTLRTLYTNEAGEVAERFPEQTTTFRLTAYFPKTTPVSEEIKIEGAGMYHKVLRVKLEKKEVPQQP